MLDLVKAILGETRQISFIDPQYFYHIIADRKSNGVAFKNSISYVFSVDSLVFAVGVRHIWDFYDFGF